MVENCELMKLFLNIFLFLLISVLFENSAFPLTNKQIKEMCPKKSRRSRCIKSLEFKKLKLLQGNQIEIPVIPFKR